MDIQGSKRATKRMIEVMKAYLEGNDIQFSYGDKGWIDTNWPQWDWGLYDYRVKPEGEV